MSLAAHRVLGVSTALYRRYRPETFADVIGQEHVTEPLMAALAADRVTHAYLFSGPRGCGKTTSARILARCLNCAQGPTATPCGQCESCVDLARGGPGSLDVVEIDAASHNGVDDARELRERAAFAPARDRYKIFILDEAHMVTTQGFNALLKLVEEPPPHIKFVFATTEPDKVIGTIRSRTHHYPFRLVAPEKLTAYLQSLADAEGIEVGSGVLPLVVRAGGGSVRDSLSVLDQLIAGTTDNALTYEHAVALLGFTHATLLDDAVDALAARDGLSLFRVVDRVIESGHAPRRFVEDLLERLRDLIVVRAAGDQAASVLRTVPADQLQRMQTQAQHLGAGALSRAADLVNDGLTEMTGATSPRLHLELLCARLLLPAADDGVDGFAARLDRLEAQMGGAGTPPASATAPAATARAGDATGAQSHGSQSHRTRPAAHASQPEPSTTAGAGPVPSGGQPERADDDATHQGSSGQPAQPVPTADSQPAPTADAQQSAQAADFPQSAPEQSPPPEFGQPEPPEQEPAREVPDTTGAQDNAAMTTDQVRRRWPEVLETLAQLKRTTWALVSQDAQVVHLTESTLSLGFSTEGLATAFRSGPHASFVGQALRETLGLEVQIQPVLGSEAPGAPGAPSPAAPTAVPPAPQPPRPAPAQPGQPEPADSGMRDQPREHAQVPPTAETGEADRSEGRAQHGDSAQPAPGAPSAGPTNSAATFGSGQAPPGTAPTPPAGGGDGWADIPVRRPPQDPPAPEPADARAAPGGGSAGAAGSGASAPESVDARPVVGGASSPAQYTQTSGETQSLGRSAHVPGHIQTPGSAQSPGHAQGDSEGAGAAESIATGGTAPATGAPDQADTGRGALLAAPPRDPNAAPPVTRLGDELDDHSPEDPDLEHTEVVGAPLVARLLGGVVIDEEIDDGEPR